MFKRGVTLVGFLVTVALAGCASDNWQEKYEEQQRLNLELSAANDLAVQQRAQETTRAEQLGNQVKQIDVEAQKARQAAEALAKQNEELRAQLSAPSKTAAPSATAGGIDMRAVQDVADQMQRDLGKSGVIDVTKDGNIEITLESDVSFASGSSDLTEAGKKSLRAISPMLKGKFAPYQVRVEGHTDSTPLEKTKAKYSDNFGLGSARSLSVVRFMESELGIEPTRLMSASRGEHEPVADNKSDKGKKQNRRVEIVVVVPHDAALSLAK